MKSRISVQWVYGARNNLELEERYNQWAKNYDDDLDRDFGWLGPALALQACKQDVPTDASEFWTPGPERDWWERYCRRPVIAI